MMTQACVHNYGYRQFSLLRALFINLLPQWRVIFGQIVCRQHRVQQNLVLSWAFLGQCLDDLLEPRFEIGRVHYEEADRTKHWSNGATRSIVSETQVPSDPTLQIWLAYSLDGLGKTYDCRNEWKDAEGVESLSPTKRSV
jgi:hypothetical protein